MKVSEELYVKNFFTIDEFEWKIKEFNILTGGMGSGKSICVKLLWFLEHILYSLVFYQSITKDDLSSSIFSAKIAKEFSEIFHAGNFDFRKTKIRYKYSCNGGVFDLRAEWNNEKNDFVWSSKYLDDHLQKWQEFFENKDTSGDIDIIVSNRIHNSIAKEFKDTFPIGTMFIPAARAIAAITDNTDFLDPFIVRFIKTCKRIIRFKNVLSSEDVNKILHIKRIRYEEKKGIIITLPNKHEVSPLYLSSGQQELLYLLIYFNYMKRYPPYIYATSTSIFIEEPEAHLFPEDQKRTIEFIVETFRLFSDKGKRPVRFYITTHSPYILNIVSTMMNRGRLKMEMDELKETEFDSLHYFNKGEVSAYSIDFDKIVRSMVSEDETYIYAQKIDEISKAIFDEASIIEDALAEITARNAK
jgi:predicted ATP-dependent endonuclease of OLD family